MPSGHAKSVDANALLEILDYLRRGKVSHGPGMSMETKLPRSISILAGSGVNPVTVKSLLSTILLRGLKLQEIHLTGGRWIEGDMWHRPEGMGMGAIDHEWGVWRTSEVAVREVRTLADSLYPVGS